MRIAVVILSGVLVAIDPAASAIAQTYVEDESPTTIAMDTSLGTTLTYEVPQQDRAGDDRSIQPELRAEFEGAELGVQIDSEAMVLAAPEPPISIEGNGERPRLEVVSPYSIIGADNRYRVSNVRSAPALQVPLILYKREGKSYMCSGWLLGPYAVGTAAHCLYNDGFSSDVQVLFGVDGRTAAAGCAADHLSVPTQWRKSRPSHLDDWGVIQLNCNAGQVYGYMGFTVPKTGPGGSGYFVTGYPGDKVTPSAGYSMWEARGAIHWIDARKAWYQIDSAGGQSGGPVWRKENGCGNCVSAIHAYGVGLGGSFNSYNSGTRITDSIRAVLNAYRSGWVRTT